MKNRNMKTASVIFKNVFLIVCTLMIVIPVLLIVVNSFKDRYEAAAMSMGIPKIWHFENYMTVIEKGKLLQSFFNSFSYSILSVILGIVLSAMAAFVLSRNRTKLNRGIYYVLILGIAMPINFVSLMKVMQLLNIINTRLGLILLYCAIQIPFSVFLIYSFISNVPKELDEAAVIDGCSPIRLFFSVIFPLVKPVTITVFVLNFLNSWNEFVLPLYYMNESTAWPMTLSVYNFFGRFQSEWNLVSADIILICIPVIVIYLLGQKYIISGMTAGAVKG